MDFESRVVKACSTYGIEPETEWNGRRLSLLGTTPSGSVFLRVYEATGDELVDRATLGRAVEDLKVQAAR